MEAEIKFEREERDGVVAVGTYLFDAARRLGIEIEAECGRRGACETCAVRVKSGGEFLSGITEKEKEHLTAKRRKNGERLSCQAKIEAAGEILIMTHEKVAPERPEFEVKHEEYRKRFDELPLEKKISSLLELEAVAFSETVSFVVNSPTFIAGKIMDVMARFGLRIDEREREARRPKEHKTAGEKTKNAETENDETANDETIDAEFVNAENDAASDGKKSKRQNKKEAASDEAAAADLDDFVS